jgi:hypothetical protein
MAHIGNKFSGANNFALCSSFFSDNISGETLILVVEVSNLSHALFDLSLHSTHYNKKSEVKNPLLSCATQPGLSITGGTCPSPCLPVDDVASKRMCIKATLRILIAQ